MASVIGMHLPTLVKCYKETEGLNNLNYYLDFALFTDFKQCNQMYSTYCLPLMGAQFWLQECKEG